MYLPRKQSVIIRFANSRAYCASVHGWPKLVALLWSCISWYSRIEGDCYLKHEVFLGGLRGSLLGWAITVVISMVTELGFLSHSS